MKLRIRGNSVRMRLTRSEVDTFGTAGKVEETVDFGDGKPVFTYALEASDAAGVSAEFIGGTIRVFVPREAARNWVESEQVGVESAETSPLRVLVEKDFACLQERPGETNEDAFPNPEPANCHAA